MRSSLIVLLLLGACARERDRPRAVTPSEARGAHAVPGHAVPESTLAAYLEASREGSSTAAALDTLLGCDARGAFVLPVAMLGAYHVLPATAGSAGDTLLGRAVVVTVAEQRADRRTQDHYLARQRLEADTLEWDLVRTDGGGWVVCNGVQFGFHQPEEATTWFPLGASHESARRLADSLYRQWRSP